MQLRKYLTLNNIVLTIALILALSWAWSTVGAMQRNYELQTQLDQAKLDNEITALQNENLKLQQAYYQTDEYLELEARAKLNKAMPGEHVVYLPKAAAPPAKTDDSAAKTTAQTNFEKWMQFLFGRKTNGSTN